MFSDAIDLEFILELGQYGSEVSWSLDTTCTNDPISGFGGQQQIKTCSLSPGEYTLVCADSYGDGWNGAQLTIQGVTYCDDFIQGPEKMVQVTITDSWSPATEANGNACIRLFL